jgi:hypothetical protein
MTEADDKFFAWLDGELSPDEAAEIEARVTASPELSRLAAQHRAMQAELRHAFDAVANAPVPEQLRVTERPPAAQVIDLGAERRTREPRQWSALPQWSAIAATLAVGIVVGTLVPGRSSAPVEVQGGKMYAAASLDRALTSQLASTPSGDIRIGITFRDQSGAICRSFAEPQASGLACRNGKRWTVRGLFGAPEGQSGEYRMAAGMDPNLAALVDSAMAGEPFDAGQERSARDRGWK